VRAVAGVQGQRAREARDECVMGARGVSGRKEEDREGGRRASSEDDGGEIRGAQGLCHRPNAGTQPLARTAPHTNALPPTFPPNARTAPHTNAPPPTHARTYAHAHTHACTHKRTHTNTSSLPPQGGAREEGVAGAAQHGGG